MAGGVQNIRINLDRAAILFLSGDAGMELLTPIFQGFGVRQPYRCATKAEALQACQEADLDLIVCDGSLPDGETYEFINTLRRSDLEPNRFTPVLVVQGHTPLAVVSKARDCGANFVVAKPLTPSTLLERVLWMAQESRPFVELDSYIGPDRRFKNTGPPPDTGRGRRRSDRAMAPPPGKPGNLKDALL